MTTAEQAPYHEAAHCVIAHVEGYQIEAVSVVSDDCYALIRLPRGGSSYVSAAGMVFDHILGGPEPMKWRGMPVGTIQALVSIQAEGDYQRLYRAVRVRGATRRSVGIDMDSAIGHIAYRLQLPYYRNAVEALGRVLIERRALNGEDAHRIIADALLEEAS